MSSHLLRPQVDAASVMLRWGLAAIFIVHGFFKLGQTGPFLEEIPLSQQNLVGWLELVCGCLLVPGLLSRLAALALAATQVGAVMLITGKYAFEGLTFGKKGVDFTKVGPEYNLVLIVMCLSVVALGSGTISLDHLLASWWRSRRGTTAPAPAAPFAATSN